MASRIEDYALVGDLQTAGLVDRTGSLDWLCLPRFDSPACFAALLGDHRHGRWLLAPAGEARRVDRRYRGDSLLLETTFHVDEGAVRVVDFMPPRGRNADVVRIVEGVSGRVEMTTRLAVRFAYGDLVPWAEQAEGALRFVGGPDALLLRTPVAFDALHPEATASFAVEPGDRVPFVLTWHASHERPPQPVEADRALADTVAFWDDWSGRCRYEGERPELVRRSLVTLKALTYEPTGGVVAAATTSLPEALGGVRNWDYRYCWLRDATFTLQALLIGGYTAEAEAWRDWLLRAVAGEPAQMHIMYGPAGERLLPEVELDWLPGYEGSRPVRIGNAASRQFQLDVYGEVMDLLHQARRAGIPPSERAWKLQSALMEFLESNWREADEGIWEVRGGRRQFTHSKVMAWVAADRAVQAVAQDGLAGDAARWEALRDEIHADVCTYGWSERRQAFTQEYGADELDAALLMIPVVGFLPPDDPRVHATVRAVEKDLCQDGFVLRYRTDRAEDGLPAGEGAFLPCSFWLADALALTGRTDDAWRLFDQLCGLANDVGLLSEEYDPDARRLVGNFPQALTHIALVDTARNLSRPGGPADERRRR